MVYLFTCRSTTRRFGCDTPRQLGIDPFRLLECRSSFSSAVYPQSSVGILPLSLQRLISSVLKLGACIAEGISPEIRFPEKLKTRSCGYTFPSGRVPRSSLLDRLSSSRLGMVLLPVSSVFNKSLSSSSFDLIVTALQESAVGTLVVVSKPLITYPTLINLSSLNCLISEVLCTEREFGPQF